MHYDQLQKAARYKIMNKFSYWVITSSFYQFQSKADSNANYRFCRKFTSIHLVGISLRWHHCDIICKDWIRRQFLANKLMITIKFRTKRKFWIILKVNGTAPLFNLFIKWITQCRNNYYQHMADTESGSKVTQVENILTMKLWFCLATVSW